MVKADGLQFPVSCSDANGSGHPEATAAELEAMTEPRSEMELQAEIDALPLKQRSDLIEAVHGGRAVNDGALAALAAEWASASRRGLLRAFVLLSPFLVVTVVAMVWLMSRHDSPLGFVGMVVIAGSALTITALLGWPSHGVRSFALSKPIAPNSASVRRHGVASPATGLSLGWPPGGLESSLERCCTLVESPPFPAPLASSSGSSRSG